ncbi:MAG: helix-turn-helix domain-containing protein [Waddliaceae bacterium]
MSEVKTTYSQDNETFIKELGDRLKLKRKELGLSLKEIENSTSIRQNYLQAIEEGDLRKMISSVYAQGFIKQYASYLGEDIEKVIQSRPDLFKSTSNQDFYYGIGTLETRGSPTGGVKWLPNSLWIAATAVIFAAAWFFAKFLDVI